MRDHESSGDEICAHSMWEVLWFRSHEPFESFVNAAQFSDSFHRHRASTVSLHAPTPLRDAVCSIHSAGPRRSGRDAGKRPPKIRPFLSLPFFSTLESWCEIRD